MSAETARARLRQVCASHDLGTAQLDALWGLLGLLEEDAHAPTTVRAARQAVDVHVADSLVALEVDAVRAARLIADLGSGAGFPGLPLAIALPDAQMHLVESQMRRCLFLQDAIGRARVSNAEVVCGRAEEWRDGGERQDVVLARALAPQPVVLEYAAPLLALGGWLVDWRGARDAAQEREAARAAEDLGLRRVEVRRVRPFAGATDRNLHLYLKDEATPSPYPRRAGVARRRPLGATPKAQAEP